MPLLVPMAGRTPTITTAEATTATPVPANVTGVWVTLSGDGGVGTAGTHVSNENQLANGGGGGGGGAIIPRSFIPITALGPTYTLTRGSSSSVPAKFTSGGVTLTAAWGNNAGSISGGAGGVASGSGFGGIPLRSGSAGGNGGSAGGGGGASANNTIGGSSGGGGGGGARGGSSGASGGSGGTVTLTGERGTTGSKGTFAGNGATGGRGGSGGGTAFAQLEWV